MVDRRVISATGGLSPVEFARSVSPTTLKTALALSMQARAAGRPELFGPGAVIDAFPFPTTRIYIKAMQFRWKMRRSRDEKEALKNANEFIEAVVDRTNSSVDEIAARTSGDQMLANALMTGLALAAAGGVVGSLVGPIGTVVGAAIGFVIGFALGLIPFEKTSFLDRWGKFVDSLAPIERLLLVAHFKEILDHACDVGKVPRKGAWRVGHSTGGFLEHTLWEGPEVLVLFCFQDLCDRDWCPQPPPGDDLEDYAVGVIASTGEDEELLAQSYLWQRLVSQNHGPAWLRDKLRDQHSVLCKNVRARARHVAADFGQMPMGQWLVDIVVARDRELRASPPDTRAQNPFTSSARR